MNGFEPKRLIEGEPRSPLVQALHGARADLGTEAELARVRAGLSVLQASGGAGPSAASSAAGSIAASGSAAVKIVLLLGAALGAAALWSAMRPEARKDAQAAAGPTRPVARLPAALPESTWTPVSVEPRREPAARAALPTRAQTKRPHGATSAAPPPDEPPAESEIVLLRRAQTLVDTRPGSALEALDRHASAYPSGVFAQERESLAIDALRKLGRREDARARGAVFIARYPSSPHARRIRAFLDLEGGAADDHKNEQAPLPTR